LFIVGSCLLLVLRSAIAPDVCGCIESSPVSCTCTYVPKFQPEVFNVVYCQSGYSCPRTDCRVYPIIFLGNFSVRI